MQQVNPKLMSHSWLKKLTKTLTCLSQTFAAQYNLRTTVMQLVLEAESSCDMCLRSTHRHAGATYFSKADTLTIVCCYLRRSM